MRVEVVRAERALAKPRPTLRANLRARFLPVLLLVAVLSLLYLSQVSDVATTGYDIADLQNQKQLLEMQNEQLRLQVAELESLDRVDREASTRLHMGPPRDVEYVTGSAVAIPTPVVPGNARRAPRPGDVLDWIMNHVLGTNATDLQGADQG